MTLPKDTLASSGKTLGQVLKSGKKTVRGTVEIPTPMVQSHHYYQYLNPS